MKKKYLGVAVAINGNIFAHPCDGSEAARLADAAARERGDYPYIHLYEGDNVQDAIDDLIGEGGE